MSRIVVSPTMAHVTNVLTHVHGFAYAFLCGRWDYFNVPLVILLASLTASCLFHLSETKHGLTGLLGLGKFSRMLLNLDRFFAILLALVVLIHAETWMTPFYVVLFTLATIATIVGELTDDVTLYVILHSFWHLSVFYMAGYIVTLSTHPSGNVLWLWSDWIYIRRLVFTLGVLVVFALAFIIVLFFHPPQITPLLETISPRITWRIARNDEQNGLGKILRLTIDDGPTTSTHKILDVIEYHDIRASYFTPGENLRNVSVGNSRYRLFNLGTVENHMYRQEGPALKMDSKEFLDSITFGQDVINSLDKKSSNRVREGRMSWLRPASGLVTSKQIDIAFDNKYRVVIGSVHPFEAKPSLFWRYAWRFIVLHLKVWFTLVDYLMPGYGQPIVILHDRPWTVDVLGEMIPWWKSRGWSIEALPTCY